MTTIAPIATLRLQFNAFNKEWRVQVREYQDRPCEEKEWNTVFISRAETQARDEYSRRLAKLCGTDEYFKTVAEA